jgi:hypothetical protein
VILRILARVMLAVFYTLNSTLLFQFQAAMQPTWQTSPTIRPAFALQMQKLRPTILAAAKRHNNPEYSHMSDETFAIVLSQILYNEHIGWFEDAFPPIQTLTPSYQATQAIANRYGSDFTVWPSNLRPSVAAELIRKELPIPGGVIAVPITISGSRIQLQGYNQQQLYAALNAELLEPELAVEYLAANLERGVYRAHYEGVPITWQTLAAWHNQGIVRPADIATNPAAQHYLARAALYRQAAEQLIAPTANQTPVIIGLPTDNYGKGMANEDLP